MIRFIADSTFGLKSDYVEKFNIKVVPLKITLDGETMNGTEENWEKFYDKLSESKDFPMTSQPSPLDWEDAVNQIFSEDADAEIIIMTIASQLSGTNNSANLASKSFADKKVTVIDSKSACLGETVLLEECVEMAENGKSYEEILDAIPTLISKVKQQFVPQTLEYLKRGGRVGKLSAIVANTLHIKPIFVYENNGVTVTKKVFGMTKAISEMVAALPQKIKRCYVCYIKDNSLVQAICEKIKAVTGFENPIVACVDPVFGSHVGIGAVGIATLEG